MEKNANPEWNQLINLQVKVLKDGFKCEQEMGIGMIVTPPLLALSASVVSVHVWTHQADHVRLVRTKINARLELEHLICSHRLTCHCVSLSRDCLTKDDAIGTTFLNLSTLSSSGGEIEGNNLGDSGDYFIIYVLAKHLFFFPLKQTRGLRPATLCRNVRAPVFWVLSS